MNNAKRRAAVAMLSARAVSKGRTKESGSKPLLNVIRETKKVTIIIAETDTTLVTIKRSARFEKVVIENIPLKTIAKAAKIINITSKRASAGKVLRCYLIDEKVG
jgi:hypothetical protein